MHYIAEIEARAPALHAVVLRSGSILCSMIAHALNNGVAVTMIHYQSEESARRYAEMSAAEPPPQPFRMATICGMSVIATRRPVTHATMPPIAIATVMSR